MSINNAYPEKPVVPYKKTTVQMPDVVIYLKSLDVPTEIKRATYLIFRNESQNGQKGINNNFVGMQCDGGRWPIQYDDKIIGTVVLHENMTGKERRFAALKDFKTSIDFLAGRVQARGLYVGGTTHKILTMPVTDKNELARAYKKEWVTGNAKAEPSAEEKNNFISMYNQAEKTFP